MKVQNFSQGQMHLPQIPVQGLLEGIKAVIPDCGVVTTGLKGLLLGFSG